MYPTRLSVPTPTIPLTKGRQTPEDTEVEQDFKSKDTNIGECSLRPRFAAPEVSPQFQHFRVKHVIFRQHPYAQHLLFIHQAWNAGHPPPVYHQHRMPSTCYTTCIRTWFWGSQRPPKLPYTTTSPPLYYTHTHGTQRRPASPAHHQQPMHQTLLPVALGNIKPCLPSPSIRLFGLQE